MVPRGTAGSSEIEPHVDGTHHHSSVPSGSQPKPGSAGVAPSGAVPPGDGGEAEAAREEERRSREDVYTAAAYGDLEKLRRLVEEEGHSVRKPDASGFYALQWSALNNKAHIAQYLLDHGAEVDARDTTGQTALHWSAVRGAQAVTELLLERGADLEAADSHGYRTMHVAAQYGQTSLLYLLHVKWQAEVDAVDGDGRSPLHWAAYKGYADSLRVLLFMDALLSRTDREGCTPLHWAALRGNLEVCTVLVQAGTKQDLLVLDSTGCTPAQLAADKSHRQVALFLSNARNVYDARWDADGKRGRLFRLGLAPVLWAIILVLIAMFATGVILCILPSSFELARACCQANWRQPLYLTSSLPLARVGPGGKAVQASRWPGCVEGGAVCVLGGRQLMLVGVRKFVLKAKSRPLTTGLSCQSLEQLSRKVTYLSYDTLVVHIVAPGNVLQLPQDLRPGERAGRLPTCKSPGPLGRILE